MIHRLKKSSIMSLCLALGLFLTSQAYADDKLVKSDQISKPMVAEKIFDKAKTNENWKLAFATGEHAQVVFMSVSPKTNPKNEIGMEVHPFDQVIMIVEGNGKAELDGKTFNIAAGDMIFIPQGTKHNVINLNPDKALKLISIYSDTDVPPDSILESKED